jgi:hypothetical protein
MAEEQIEYTVNEHIKKLTTFKKGEFEVKVAIDAIYSVCECYVNKRRTDNCNGNAAVKFKIKYFINLIRYFMKNLINNHNNWLINSTAIEICAKLQILLSDTSLKYITLPQNDVIDRCDLIDFSITFLQDEILPNCDDMEDTAIDTKILTPSAPSLPVIATAVIIDTPNEETK